MVILVFLPGKNEYIKKQNERCTVYMNNGPVKNAWSHLRMVSVLYPTIRMCKVNISAILSRTDPLILRSTI
jgi:hypothetical protein